MLWIFVALFVVGVVNIVSGKATLREVARCSDDEEKAALRRLAKRKRNWGIVEVIVGTPGCLILLALAYVEIFR